jgi:Domain of unknown function (DUF4397)
MRLRIPALILAATLAACGKDDNTIAPTSASARLKFVQLLRGPTTVDFAVGDQRTFPGLTYNFVAPALSGSYTALAAETPLRLRVYDGAAAVIDTTTTLVTDASYTVVATGVAGGTGVATPKFVVLTDNVTAPKTDSIRLRVMHASSGAGPIDVHAVLVGTPFSATTRIVASLSFRGTSTADLPAGSYQVCVIGAGGIPNASGSNCSIFLATGSLPAGTVATAFARDPSTPTETLPQLQLVRDRTP